MDVKDEADLLFDRAVIMKTAANLPNNFFANSAVKSFLIHYGNYRSSTSRQVAETLLSKMESRYRMTSKTQKLSDRYITVSWNNYFKDSILINYF